MYVYGRVFMSTAGLGIGYGEIADSDSVPWDTWLETHFTADELQDATIANASADPDHDNLSNLLEWILGTNPKEADQISQSISIDATNRIRFTLRKQAQLRTATLAIKVSQDLQTWQPIEASFDLLASERSEDDLYQEIVYIQKSPAPITPLFLRLFASANL